MAKYYIGYDCGTMGTKVAIYSEDSTLIGESYRAHKIDYPKPGWAEMNPEQFYKVAIEGIKECVVMNRIDPHKVRGISCSGVICGILPIDENWNAVGPYIPYLDGRAKEETKFVAENVEPIWAIEAGNAFVGPYMPPMIIKWLLNNRKEIVAETKKFITCSQYVLGKLAGLKAKDAFIDWAHLSGWIIGFNAYKRDWSEKQIELLDIPYELLPIVKKPWDVIGTLTKEEADKIGLIEGIPLIAGAGDMQQSNLGSNVVDIGTCADIAGTASNFNITVGDFNEAITDKKILGNAMATFADQYIYWGVVPAGGLSLRWFRDEVLMQKGDDEFYERMNRLAEKSPIGADFSLFFPFLQGRMCPFWPNASAAWIGLFGSNNSGTLWRSMLESIAFEYLSWVQNLRTVGLNPNRVIAQGGGSKGKLWNQIKADILNIPYVTVDRTEQAVLGNAILAAYGVGDIRDMKQTLNEWVKIKETFIPKSKNNDVYMKIYRKREEILNGPLHDIFDLIADLHTIHLSDR